MRAIAIHLRSRLLALLGEPFSLAFLLFSCGISLFYWPGTTDSWVLVDAAGGDLRALEAVGVMLLWCYTWPLMATVPVGGSVTGTFRGDVMTVRAMPALPIGMRSRAVAEALLVVLVVFIVRLPFFFFEGAPFPNLNVSWETSQLGGLQERFVLQSVAGTGLIFAFLVAWTAPARTLGIYWARPFLMIALLYGAFSIGLLNTTAGCVAAGALLTIACLATLDVEISLPRIAVGSSEPAAARWRPARHPLVQLRRDFWLQPLRVAALLLSLEVVFLAFGMVIELPEYGLYFATSLVFGLLFSFVVLRPLGCLVFSAGFEDGGFPAAWTVLPVAKHTVMRGVYLHGLISSIGLWIAIMGINALSTWIDSGQPGITDLDGDPAWRLLGPLAAIAPCLAGGVTAAAAGDGKRGLLSLAAMLTILLGHFACLILDVSLAIELCAVILLAAIGALPPLVHLRGRMETKAAG